MKYATGVILLRFFPLIVCLSVKSEGFDASGPVGFHTITIPGNGSALIGMLPRENVVLSDVLDSASGTILTDSNNDFRILLSAPSAYVVELNTGKNEGKVLDVVSFNEHELIVSEAVEPETNVACSVRALRRLSEIINPLLLLSTHDYDPDKADLILVPTKSGSFNRFFVSSHTRYPVGFFNAETGLPEDPYLHYSKSILVFRRAATDLTLTISGSIKDKRTSLPVNDIFNYFSSLTILSVNLSNSDLDKYMHPGNDRTADIVWIQESPAKPFQRYFYSDGMQNGLASGWWKLGDPLSRIDPSEVVLGSGFIIQRRSQESYNVILAPLESKRP